MPFHKIIGWSDINKLIGILSGELLPYTDPPVHVINWESKLTPFVKEHYHSIQKPLHIKSLFKQIHKDFNYWIKPRYKF